MTKHKTEEQRKNEIAAAVALTQDATAGSAAQAFIEQTEKKKTGRPVVRQGEGKQVSVWLDAETLRALRVDSAERGVSVSTRAGDLIKAGLNDKGDN